MFFFLFTLQSQLFGWKLIVAEYFFRVKLSIEIYLVRFFPQVKFGEIFSLK